MLMWPRWSEPRAPEIRVWSGATIRSAMELTADVDGLRLGLRTALGDGYRVRVSDDGSVVGLWRHWHEKRPALAGRASRPLQVCCLHLERAEATMGVDYPPLGKPAATASG